MKWTRQEIEDYKKRSLQYFNEKDGFRPVDEIDQADGLSLLVAEPEVNVRYSLADEPYSFLYDFVEPEEEYNVWGNTKEDVSGIYRGEPSDYDEYLGPMKYPASILGINIRDRFHNETYGVRLSSLIPKVHSDEGMLYPNGDVNIFLHDIVTKSKPYATVKEVLDSLIKFIGSNEIYFSVHETVLNNKKTEYVNCNIVSVYSGN